MVINKSKEKMRCKEKTESITLGKLKVFSRGWEGDTRRKGRHGRFPMATTAKLWRRETERERQKQRERRD